MARSKLEIENELKAVRRALTAMVDTGDESVGLKNMMALGEKQAGGVRPTYAMLQQREKDLLHELAQLPAADGTGRRSRVYRSQYGKGLC